MILERFYHGADCVVGRLLFGGRQVYTIERPWLLNKPFESCIPEGDYALNPYSSKRFPHVWQIADVPGRTHILFHAANYAHQLAGCIAPGTAFRISAPSEDREASAVWSSAKACREVFEYLASVDRPRLSVISAHANLEDCV